MFKKKIAKRKLRCKCKCCGKEFLKGNVYYKERIVAVEEDFPIDKTIILAYNSYLCPKCKYKQEQQNKRFLKFKGKCTHPEKFIETKYDYIPGECVQEPQYDYCRLCGKIL